VLRGTWQSHTNGGKWCNQAADRQLLQNVHVPEDDIGKKSKHCTGSVEGTHGMNGIVTGDKN